MHLDQWLKQVHDEEVLSKEASGLELLFNRMSPSDLLDIACGQTTIEKVAADMSQAQRESLPSKSFAVPESKAKKIGVAGEIQGEAKGKYPIPDEKHARNALARVSQHGTPAEREAVRKKVYGKYPGLREGFEESHGGESPTSKENVKKVEQGGIGKTSQAKLDFMDKVARQVARQHYEVAKEASLSLRQKAGLVASGVKDAHKLVGELGADAAKHLKKKVKSLVKKGGDEGMTKSDEFTSPQAQQKAKALQSAMKATKGAPTKVRKSAMRMAGREINKVAQQDWYSRNVQARQAMRESMPLQVGAGALGGGLLGHLAGGGIKGKLLGAGLGAGAGLATSALAKKRREALAQM